MKITFKIKESLEEIINEIKNPSEVWETIINDNGSIELNDPDFWSSATCEFNVAGGKNIHITTAWSKFRYLIYETSEGAFCDYDGAYRALLSQYLLPTITPLFTGDEIVQSSLTALPRLEEYINTQDDFAIWRKKHKTLRTHPHPECIYNWLKSEFIRINCPVQEEGKHPDECAVFIGDHPDYLNWRDQSIEWNGNVLRPGPWLFPNGEIVYINEPSPLIPLEKKPNRNEHF